MARTIVGAGATDLPNVEFRPYVVGEKMLIAASRSEIEYAPPPGAGASTLGRWRVGRAYRDGRLVCGCVQVAIRLDDRLGLTRRERRRVRVRFCEPVADDLRIELADLARRRGPASERAAERIDPVELVIDDPAGDPERITGRLRPPHRRHGQLREIEFGFGQLTHTQ